MASAAEVQAAARCNSLDDLLLTVRLEAYTKPLQRAGLDLEGLLRVQSKDHLKQRYGLKLAHAAKLFCVAQRMRSERQKTMHRSSHGPETAATSNRPSLASLLFESRPRTPADFQQTEKLEEKPRRKGKDKSWAELKQDERFAARRLGWQTEETWEAGESTDASETWFRDLPKAQRDAAELLGYDATTWDRELEEPAENEPEQLEEQEPLSGLAAIRAVAPAAEARVVPQHYASFASAAQERESRVRTMQQKNQKVVGGVGVVGGGGGAVAAAAAGAIQGTPSGAFAVTGASPRWARLREDREDREDSSQPAPAPAPAPAPYVPPVARKSMRHMPPPRSALERGLREVPQKERPAHLTMV
eukprot:COSAG02_NODE_13819_length_1343_cov_1.669614_1_plen_359_part_10